MWNPNGHCFYLLRLIIGSYFHINCVILGLPLPNLRFFGVFFFFFFFFKVDIKKQKFLNTLGFLWVTLIDLNSSVLDLIQPWSN